VYYYPSEKSSWYHDPEHKIPQAALPSIPQLPIAKLSKKEAEKMCTFDLTHVTVIQQRTKQRKTIA